MCKWTPTEGFQERPHINLSLPKAISNHHQHHYYQIIISIIIIKSSASSVQQFQTSQVIGVWINLFGAPLIFTIAEGDRHFETTFWHFMSLTNTLEIYEVFKNMLEIIEVFEYQILDLRQNIKTTWKTTLFLVKIGLDCCFEDFLFFLL